MAKRHPSFEVLKQVFGKPEKELKDYVWKRENLTVTYCLNCKSIKFFKKENKDGLRIAYMEHDNFDERFHELINWAVK